MSLSPEIEVNADQPIEVETSYTFEIDFETNRLTGKMINGLESIKQFVVLAIRIPRYAYPILSSNIGAEIEALLADPDTTLDYKKMELPRLITEALIYDERIDSVLNFNIDHQEDSFHASFTVHSVEGIFEAEEVF
ncbi:DUF2634 domain-containing protein [Jeotgalibacillus malaysiensis]|uniref:DUF2634 domain-containing protein n=1 Tax=Jeotgalibacillus malaysiensis TaxID=1508404 RepID=UPI0038502C2A